MCGALECSMEGGCWSHCKEAVEGFLRSPSDVAGLRNACLEPVCTPGKGTTPDDGAELR